MAESDHVIAIDSIENSLLTQQTFMDAVSLVEKVLLNDDLLFNLFHPVLQLFLPEGRVVERDTLLHHVKERLGLNKVRSTRLSDNAKIKIDSPTKYSHHYMEADQSTLTIYVNWEYMKEEKIPTADATQTRRQFFFIVTKLLHEITHFLTAVFNNLARVPQEKPSSKKPRLDRNIIPEKIGKIWDKQQGKYIGDSGSAFEDILLGGRLLVEYPKQSFNHNLLLVKIKSIDAALSGKNIEYKSICDEVIVEFYNLCHPVDAVLDFVAIFEVFGSVEDYLSKHTMAFKSPSTTSGRESFSTSCVLEKEGDECSSPMVPWDGITISSVEMEEIKRGDYKI